MMINKKIKYAVLIGIGVALILSPFLLLKTGAMPVLDPKGMIAEKQRDLFGIATFLMLLVVIPVFIMTAVISWRYRAGNKRAKYSPEWDHNSKAELIWWGFPCVIILILSVITWRSTHELDPFEPIVTGTPPMKVQVIALQWRWLFLYPEQGIATLNFVEFPEQVPIDFEITSDAPMNSFWIPQLGGQIYAMPGMKTKLHLIANEEGVFRGSSANISGEGFANMWFMAKAVTQVEFDAWVREVKQSGGGLSLEVYKELAKPSVDHEDVGYVLKKEDLFDWSIMKYMMPGM